MTLEQHAEAHKMIGESVWSGGRIWQCAGWHSVGTLIMLELRIGDQKRLDRMERVRRAF